MVSYDTQTETLVVDRVLDGSRHRYRLDVALALGGVITRSTPAECRRLRSCSVVELCSDGLLLNVSALATSWIALLLPRSLWLEWVSAAVTDALANLGSCGRLVRDAFPAILYGVMNTFTLI